MYVRFFRWASDRVEENGIIAFVSNSSFVHKPSFDGFRRVVAQEFNEIWILDLKGDARTAGERRRREGGNIFGNQIRVGIAIYFCVKKQGTSGCIIRYVSVRDYAGAGEKLDFLRTKPIGERRFQEIKPDGDGNWLDLTENDFVTFLPIGSTGTKSTGIAGQERAIFKLFSLGISINRDEWLYDICRDNLERKIGFLIDRYDAAHKRARGTKNFENFRDEIKWSKNLKRRLLQKRSEILDRTRIIRANYKTFTYRWFYYSSLYIDEAGASHQIVRIGNDNTAICFSDVGSRTDYCVLAIAGLADLHFGAAVDAYHQVSRYRFSATERLDNITDWALAQFRDHYASGNRQPKRLITKDTIFYYVYGVLHDPIYRERYESNLRREFPHIPFYSDFWRWAGWGETLMNLHIGYETVEPWPLRARFERG